MVADSVIRWITVTAIYLVTYISIAQWFHDTQNVYVTLWWIPLTIGALCMIQFRRQPNYFRWAMLVPVVVLFLTGIMGRWGSWSR